MICAAQQITFIRQVMPDRPDGPGMPATKHNLMRPLAAIFGTKGDDRS